MHSSSFQFIALHYPTLNYINIIVYSISTHINHEYIVHPNLSSLTGCPWYGKDHPVWCESPGSAWVGPIRWRSGSLSSTQFSTKNTNSDLLARYIHNRWLWILSHMYLYIYVVYIYIYCIYDFFYVGQNCVSHFGVKSKISKYSQLVLFSDRFFENKLL